MTTMTRSAGDERREPADRRREERLLAVAGERQELLRAQRARRRPEPRARAARHDHRVDLRHGAEHGTTKAEKSRDHGTSSISIDDVSAARSHTLLFLLVSCLRHSASAAASGRRAAARRGHRGLAARDRARRPPRARGAGFPQGRAARVTFRGTLWRPGQPPRHRRDRRGRRRRRQPATASRSSCGEPLEERFCGHGDHAVAHHVDRRRRGRVRVEHARRAAARRRHARHDASTSRRRRCGPASSDARTAEGAARPRVPRRHARAPRPRAGCPSRSSRPARPRERAGFQVGDLIAAVDGVHVREIADVAPGLGAQRADHAPPRRLGQRRDEDGRR